VRLYPAIDIRGGRAVRLVQGDYDREVAFEKDPAEPARRFADEGAEFLHVVDLDGARDGEPSNLEAIERVAALGCPVQVGGGLRHAAAVDRVFAAGAERVVIGTAAMRSPAFLDTMLERYGDRVVVAVDARHGRIALAGWEEIGDSEVTEAVVGFSERGVQRFLFTPIEVDGTLDGPGTEQMEQVAGATASEVIYSGGVGSLDDLRGLAADAPENVGGVVVGRALYEGRFTVAEAIEALR
jgi:phosphoribosylformimino-5-aminoimidazole carboxamide ribotide isomerase